MRQLLVQEKSAILLLLLLRLVLWLDQVHMTPCHQIPTRLGSAMLPRKGNNHNTSPTTVSRVQYNAATCFASTEQIWSPITLQMTTGASPVKSADSLDSLNTCQSSTRRQAAEALGILAQEGSPTHRTGGSPSKSKPAAVPIVVEATDADISVGGQLSKRIL
jgi:hypothetical protein